jgi:hypothetical protein
MIMNELKNPGLNPQAIQSLAGAAKWAKFLAILGFIVSGLMFVFSFFGGSVFSSALFEAIHSQAEVTPDAAAVVAGAGWVMTVTYLIGAIISLIIYFFLYKFGKGVQNALASGDEVVMADGLRGLKIYFMIQGIIIIVALAFCAIAVILGVVAAIAAA